MTSIQYRIADTGFVQRRVNGDWKFADCPYHSTESGKNCGDWCPLLDLRPGEGANAYQAHLRCGSGQQVLRLASIPADRYE